MLNIFRFVSLMVIQLVIVPITMAQTELWSQYQDEATTAYQAGEYVKAESSVRQAIGISKNVTNGRLHHASSLNLLAFIQSANQDLPSALISMKEAVEVAKTAVISPNEQLATMLFNYGLLLQRADQIVMAKNILEEAISQYQALNNTGNGQLWQAVLAYAQMAEKDETNTAVTLLIDALAGFPNHEGFMSRPEDDAYADLAYLAGKIYFEQQRFSSSIEVIKPALEIHRTVELMGLLASNYDQLGRSAEASAIRAEILLAQSQQPASMVQVMHLNEQAMHAQTQLQYDLAANYYQQALDVLSQMGKTEVIEQALILGNLASVKLAQKDNTTALALFEQSYVLHLALNTRPQEATAVAGYLGGMYYNLRQYRQAEPIFLQALAWSESTANIPLEEQQVALENLIALYTMLKNDAQKRLFERRLRTLKSQMK